MTRSPILVFTAALAAAAVWTPNAANAAGRPYRWRSGHSTSLASNGINVKDLRKEGKAVQQISSAEGEAGELGSMLRDDGSGNLESTPVVDAPGSRNIHIQTSQSLHKTEYAGLTFRRNCVVDIREDGTLVAHQAGVRATDGQGHTWVSRPARHRGKTANLFFRR